MTYRLFVDSDTGVDINPEYDYRENSEKVESRHRSRSGREFVYRWGGIGRISFSVMYVNSSFKAQVNSWWDANTDLLFMEVGTTEVFSCHITNKKKPVDRFIRPYNDLFRGKIELGTY
jgi:hypothetical protein